VPKLFHFESPQQAGDQRSDEACKCDWLVDSLRLDRTQASRRVKIEPVDFLLPESRFAAHILKPVHSPDYIAAVWRDGFRESETPLPSRLFLEAIASVHSLHGAACCVASAQFPGSSSRIVGSVGGGVHHARNSSCREGMAFNALAVVARSMLKDPFNREQKSVLIIDADGDCGGGTAELIADTPRVRQVDIAVDAYDAYSDTDNASLYLVSRASEYLSTLKQALADVRISGDSMPLCLYTAGVSGHEEAERGLPGITADVLAERDRIVFDWCRRAGLRLAYTLGSGTASGSMTRERLVSLHRNTVEVAAVAASSEAGG
jgi:acetoin utilization deacetylase AcuC-like enzyme